MAGICIRGRGSSDFYGEAVTPRCWPNTTPCTLKWPKRSRPGPPDVAARLDEARDGILTCIAFIREAWRQVWPDNPQERLNKESGGAPTSHLPWPATPSSAWWAPR